MLKWVYWPSPPHGALSSSSSPALHSLKQYLAGVASMRRWEGIPVRWNKKCLNKFMNMFKPDKSTSIKEYLDSVSKAGLQEFTFSFG